MEFLEGTSFEEAANKRVAVVVVPGYELAVCRTFINDGDLWVDVVPHFNRKHIAPVPEDARISRNVEKPDLPEIGIFIPATSELGALVLAGLRGRSQFPPDHKPIDPAQN